MKNTIERVGLNILKRKSITVVSENFAQKISDVLRTNFKNAYFKELLLTVFYYSVVESCSIVNQNIVKTKFKFKINHASMNDYNYTKSLKVVFKSTKKKFYNNSNCPSAQFVLKIQSQKKHIIV